LCGAWHHHPGTIDKVIGIAILGRKRPTASEIAFNEIKAFREVFPLHLHLRREYDYDTRKHVEPVLWDLLGRDMAYPVKKNWHRLSHVRQIGGATRYDKLARSFMARLHLAALLSSSTDDTT
jgi:hypothetical protein